MTNSKIRWLAVWGKDFAYALDVYPEEEIPHRISLIKYGDHVAGPFDTIEEAEAVAFKGLSPHTR